MPINQLYHTWFERIAQLRPGERITRLRNLAWLIVGIFQSRSVHLSKIASKIPGSAKQQSFRTRKNPKLETKATHTYEQPGTYKVLVKVMDIFGNDTTKMVEVNVL